MRMKVNKELTHIYHINVSQGTITVGSAYEASEEQEELFEKSLVLTSDIKRLPYLLGGKVGFWWDANILTNMLASGLSGVGVDAILMNGEYTGNAFANLATLLADDNAKDDMLLWSHADFQLFVGTAPEYGVNIEVQTGHWDFEGAVILYDKITLLIFSDANTNVSTTGFTTNVKALAEIEIDWKQINKPELMDFIVEHIYAKQGD